MKEEDLLYSLDTILDSLDVSGGMKTAILNLSLGSVSEFISNSRDLGLFLVSLSGVIDSINKSDNWAKTLNNYINGINRTKNIRN